MQPSKPHRWQMLDVLRGIAVGLMVVYHFFFDLNYFGYIQANFNYDPFWLSFRAVILSLFLGVSGVSLHCASLGGIRWKRYFKGLIALIGAAILVTITSFAIFPESFIYFGVLHCIALSRVLGLLFLNRGRFTLIAGMVIVLMGHTVKDEIFNLFPLQWIGLMTFKPITEDYVPLFPWFGIFLLGMWAGQKLFSGERQSVLTNWESRSRFTRFLQWAGQHSLVIYLVHQPVLFALFYAVGWMV